MTDEERNRRLLEERQKYCDSLVEKREFPDRKTCMLALFPDSFSAYEKVKALGHDPEEFMKEIFEIDRKVTNECLLKFDYSRQTLREKIGPYLTKFKEKYGVFPYIGLCGIDVVRIDNELNYLVERKFRRLRKNERD